MIQKSRIIIKKEYKKKKFLSFSYFKIKKRNILILILLIIPLSQKTYPHQSFFKIALFITPCVLSNLFVI